MASYDGATLKVTELFSKAIVTFVYGCVLNFIYPSALGVAEIAKSTHLWGCPYTFVSIVYIWKWDWRGLGLRGVGLNAEDTFQLN